MMGVGEKQNELLWKRDLTLTAMKVIKYADDQEGKHELRVIRQ